MDKSTLMGDWETRYKEKKCSALEALGAVQASDRILVGGALARPYYLLAQMVEHAQNFHNVKIMHGLSHGGEEYCEERYKENFLHEALFVSKGTRQAVKDGRAKFYPHYYCELSYFFEEGTIPIDVFMFQVTPPDKYGYCSCGLNADFIQEAVDAADVVIVQVNSKLPWCSAEDCLVHIDRIDFIVEHEDELPEVQRGELTDTALQIGKYCASLINDGDTIQVGIGNLPDAICESLKDKKHLGVHSEMIGDGIMNLWLSGAVDNSKKSIDRGSMVASFVLGTQKLYDFIDHNPIIKLKSVRRVSHPFEIAKSRNQVSINTCIEVDLMGQVVAGTNGISQISGAGGQSDFIRGILLSQDGSGKSIIVLTSTYEKHGIRKSRILGFLTDGSAVTVSREDVDYIITEYGIAHLRGKTLKERAKAMISLAHPDFRPELIEIFEKRFRVKYQCER